MTLLRLRINLTRCVLLASLALNTHEKLLLFPDSIGILWLGLLWLGPLWHRPWHGPLWLGPLRPPIVWGPMASYGLDPCGSLWLGFSCCKNVVWCQGAGIIVLLARAFKNWTNMIVVESCFNVPLPDLAPSQFLCLSSMTLHLKVGELETLRL